MKFIMALNPLFQRTGIVDSGVIHSLARKLDPAGPKTVGTRPA
jgi:hypothetical protein